MKLLRCGGVVAVDCKPDGDYLKVGVLVVRHGESDQDVTLYDADTEDAYPVRIPPAGCYYAVLLERLPDAPTL